MSPNLIRTHLRQRANVISAADSAIGLTNALIILTRKAVPGTTMTEHGPMIARVNGVTRITNVGTAGTVPNHGTEGVTTMMTGGTVTMIIMAAAGLRIDTGSRIIIAPMDNEATMTEAGRGNGAISTITQVDTNKTRIIITEGTNTIVDKEVVHKSGASPTMGEAMVEITAAGIIPETDGEEMIQPQTTTKIPMGTTTATTRITRGTTTPTLATTIITMVTITLTTVELTIIVLVASPASATEVGTVMTVGAVLLSGRIRLA